MAINSYPSIYAMGHKALNGLLEWPVYVEEKVDGSQFSFGLDREGELKVRSKGCQLYVEAPEKMFEKAVETAKELAPLLQPGQTVRCEYLAKPKHNTLAYGRVPAKHLIVFDVNDGLESYLTYQAKKDFADRLGLETVPLLFEGKVESLADFRQFLDRESCLGGPKIEGVVVKPVGYGLFGSDKKALIGKFVSESFKESHQKEWKDTNHDQTSILDQICEQYRVPARWHKAIQHLKEAGKLEGSPRDIGLLMKEVAVDIHKECSGEIKDSLFEWAWKRMSRKVTQGLPEWYKEQLLASAFEETIIPAAVAAEKAKMEVAA